MKKNWRFTKWMGPVLDAVRALGGTATPKMVQQQIQQSLKLPEELLADKNKSGQTKFYNELHWARQYLVWEGLLDSHERGQWKLTDAGKQTFLDETASQQLAEKWAEVHKQKSGEEPDDDAKFQNELPPDHNASDPLVSQLRARLAQGVPWSKDIEEFAAAFGNLKPDQAAQLPNDQLWKLWTATKFAQTGTPGLPTPNDDQWSGIREMTKLLCDRSQTLGERFDAARTVFRETFTAEQVQLPVLLRTLLILEGGRFGSISTKSNLNPLLQWAGKPEMDYRNDSSITSALESIGELIEEWAAKAGAKSLGERASIPWHLSKIIGGGPTSNDEEEQPLALKETPPQNSNRRYWLYSPGEQARFWQECQDKGILVIGYDDLEDFHQYKSQEEIEQTLKEMWGKEERPYNHSRAVWEFAKVIRPGDVVIVKKGRSEYLGYGIVNGPCERDDARPEFKSFRKMVWKKTGTWLADFDLVVKTLTDITKYPEYVVKLKNLIGIETESVLEPKSQTPSHSSQGIAYWWLNANPKIWDIRGAPVGAANTYTTHNEAGNKRQKYKHFLAVKPGDLVLGYVTSPEKEIVALCQITKGLHTTDEGEVIEFKKIEEFKQPVTWAELQSAPALKHCEPIESNQGSLFKVTEDEFDFIRSIIDERNLVTTPVKIVPYTKADAMAGLFMAETQLDLTLARLKQKKALVLQGPPGVGKTFVAKRLAYALMGQKDDHRVSMVQFHPSYGYEDFIQGFRPSRGGGLERRDGVFYEFARLARNDPDHDWFFIIDEINRGNLAKIFGELLMLLEADKRGPDHVVSLTYSEKGEQFYLPRNLHVIGTMNTADRSLAMVDYALRRRFAFVTLEPAVNSTAFGDWLTAAGASKALLDQIRAAVDVLNAAIDKERDLGERFRIGHSFFCPAASQKPDTQWYCEIIQTEIKPLLEEYFDSKDRVENLIAEVLK